MPLQTQGFTPTVFPTTPQIPGNVGALRPALDVNEILALSQQHLAALQQSHQNAVQNQQVAAEQQRLANEGQQLQSALATQGQQRALAAAAGGREAALFPVQLSGATTEAAQRLQNLQQQGEAFQAGAPVRALAGAKAAREQSLIGLETEVSDFQPSPDGNGYIQTVTVKQNGIPVHQESKRTMLPPGVNPAMLQGKPGPTVYDIATQAPHATRINYGGQVVDAATGQPVDQSLFTFTAPTKAAIAGQVAEAQAGSAGKKQLSKEDAKDISEYPSEKAKLTNAQVALTAELQNIDDAKKLANSYQPGIWKSLMSQIPGTPEYNLAAKLQSIQGAAGREALANVKNVRSMAEYNGLTQALGSLRLAQEPADLRASLDKYAAAARAAYAAANNAVETRHQQALQRLGQFAHDLGDTSSKIPQAAIEHLLANPDLSPAFDEKYGAGQAGKILGQ